MGAVNAVTPHQDSTFLHTEPMKIVGVWLALEDVTLDNGCLWFIPGSHKRGIDRRFVRNPDPQSPNLTMYTAPNPDYDDSKFIPGPVPKGESGLIRIVLQDSLWLRGDSSGCLMYSGQHVIIVLKTIRVMCPHSRRGGT